MIIRLFSLPLLLVLASAAQADTLYRWIEADGSITFSPKKPPAGIEYTVIGTDDDSGSDSRGISRSSAPAAQTRAGTDSGSVDRSIQRSVDASVNWMSPSQRNTQSMQNIEPPFAAARPASQTNADVRSVANQNKRSRQCAELSMRVTSLEERMKSRMSPDAMDRTVLSMARYQQSLERFCR